VLEPLDAEAWRLEGALAGASAAEGSCGGAGAEDVLVFTAPAAGFWSFSRDPDASEVPFAVYLRRECAVERTEVSCSRLPEGAERHEAAAHVELAAGESVFIFVDADAPGDAGDYAVLATRTAAPAPPRLTSAEAFRRPDGVVATRITGEDPNGDAHVLVYALESALGQVVFPVPGHGDGLPFFPATPLAGRRTFEFTLPDVVKVPCDRLSLFLVDATGLESEVVDVAIAAAPPRALGEDCDVHRLTDVCVAGSACSPGDRGGLCEAVEGPRVETAVFQIGGAGYVYADLDVSGPPDVDFQVTVTLLPADRDTPIVLGPGGERVVEFPMREGEYWPAWSRGVRMLILGGDYLRLDPFTEARRVRVEVGLAGGPRQDTVTVPLLPGPIVGEGLPCDLSEYLPISCDEGLTCVRDVGAPNAFDGVCADAAPPVIDEAIINVDRFDRFRITVRGRTRGAPLEGFEAHLLGEDGDEPLFAHPPAWGGDDPTDVGTWFGPIAGPAFEVTYSPQLDRGAGISLRLADVPLARRLVIRPLNEHVGPGEAVVVPIGRTVQAAAGEPCDVQGVVSECGALGACVAAPDAAAGVCEARTPPHLTGARAAFNPESQRLGVTLAGVDPDGDAEGTVKMRLFVGDPDAGGEEISVTFVGPVEYAAFESFEVVENAPERFEGATYLTPYWLSNWQVAAVTHVQVSVLDGFGLESEVLTAEVPPAEVAAVGAACDPLYVFQRCEGGGLCPSDAPVCRRNVCGDGLPGLDEACDDGNRLPGDGCSAACELERRPLPLDVGGLPELVMIAGDVTDWVDLQLPRAGFLRIQFDATPDVCAQFAQPELILRARQPDDTWFTVWPPFPDQHVALNGLCPFVDVNVPAGDYRLLIDSGVNGATAALTATLTDL
jgi:cysteine-rich repeat protein